MPGSLATVTRLTVVGRVQLRTRKEATMVVWDDVLGVLDL
jgi:hypothetical protein